MATKTHSASSHRFRTILLTAGKTATGIEIPKAVIEKLGAGKKPPVQLTINGYTYRSTVAVMGGRYMVGVSAEVRAAAGVAGGDKIEVGLELDTAPRTVQIPEALAEALTKNKKAKENFDKLSYSNQKRLALPIEQAKTDDTRQRNVEKAMAELLKI